MIENEESHIGIRCIKYLLCLANFLFIMTALLIISVGSTIYALYNGFDRFLEESYLSPASLLIAIGIIILFVSIVGFVGAVKESSCITMLFSVLLGIILVLEIGAAFAAFAVPGGVTRIVQDNLQNVMDNYNHTEEAAAMDYLQFRLNCCGCYGPEDWKTISPVNNSAFAVPDSCCMDPFNDTNCIVKKDGCLYKLTHLVYQSSLMLGTGALSIALVQVLGMTFACILGKSIRRAKSERELRRWQFRADLINGDSNYTELARGDVKVPVMYTPTSSTA